MKSVQSTCDISMKGKISSMSYYGSYTHITIKLENNTSILGIKHNPNRMGAKEYRMGAKEYRMGAKEYRMGAKEYEYGTEGYVRWDFEGDIIVRQ